MRHHRPNARARTPALGLALLSLIAAGCRGGAPAAEPDPRAGSPGTPGTPGTPEPPAPVRTVDRRLLLCGGTILVAAPGWTVARALYAEDGRIVAVGEDEARVRAVARHPYTTVDLDGAVAVPGLIDAHGHLEGLGEALEQLDLRGVASYRELVERVARRAAELPAGTWIQGRGWDQNLWPGGEFPHHRELSAATPDHPVALERIDGHALLANAKALELAGLGGTQRADAVEGGRILLDGEGRASGVLVDRAASLVSSRVPPPRRADRERRVLRAAREMLAHGLTGMHDMGEDAELAGILAQLAAERRLGVEVAGYLAEGALESGDPALRATPAAARGAPAAARPAPPAPEYRLVGAKLYMDGALGSRGAALLEDYSDEPGNRGLALLEPERLDALLAACEARGLQPAVHAIGDLANRRVLDAYERRMGSSPAFAALRPRIEHAQVVAREDWPRFLALGVVPSMQPTHATSDMPWAPARVGAARVEGAYAWRRLDPSGRALAFGSDFPVELCDPLAGLYAARTCADPRGEPAEGFRPDQRLDAATALAAFTANAARAARQEADFGSLEEGRVANVTVLDLDPLTCSPAAPLGGDHVRMTIVRGRVVYDAQRRARAAAR